jgi:hypothetical protein
VWQVCQVARGSWPRDVAISFRVIIIRWVGGGKVGRRASSGHGGESVVSLGVVSGMDGLWWEDVGVRGVKLLEVGRASGETRGERGERYQSSWWTARILLLGTRQCRTQ